MKKLFKLLTLIIVMLTFSNGCFAFSVSKIDKLLTKSNLSDTSTIAISVRNASSNEVVYEQNQNKLLHPASTLKIPTAYFAINTLGYDYFFKTQFYKDSNDDLYIKLGADPFLTTAKLKAAFQALKEQGYTSFNNLYIDDSVLDKKEFANGWMWDDDVNPFTPKVSSYNLDGNTVRLSMSAGENGLMTTNTRTKYPMSVFAHIKNGAKPEYLEINRYNWNSSEVVEIYGQLSNPKPITIPISSMRKYFIYTIDNILEEDRFDIKSTLFSSKLVPENAEMIHEISSSVKPVLPNILQRSNNLMAETIFKLAGGVKYSGTGTDELSIYAMKEFYKDLHVDFDKVVIKDGCGVSRNNLVSADWMTTVLNKIYKEKNFETFKEYMAQAGDGTLSERLYDLRGEAWLKTGSLANISAISGYIKSQDGNTYAVTIFIQNFMKDVKEIKKLEDEIITIIYNR